MIYARDKGRMCNNMLQYAHVYALAREHGRRAVSMRFCYKYPWFAISRSKGHFPLRYFLVKMAAKMHLMPVVSFNDPHISEAGRRAGEQEILSRRNVIVEGWEVRFYDLFLKYRDEITELFRFLPEVESAAMQSLKGREDAIKIGVHVRRGDYARWQNGKYLFDDAQYAGVIAGTEALYPGRKICAVICTNDPALDRGIYQKILKDTDLVFTEGNPAEDLCTLSHCDILIGAPSTFSLTAALYRDLPLYWISDPEATVRADSFKHFDYLFRHII